MLLMTSVPKRAPDIEGKKCLPGKNYERPVSLTGYNSPQLLSWKNNTDRSDVVLYLCGYDTFTLVVFGKGQASCWFSLRYHGFCVLLWGFRGKKKLGVCGREIWPDHVEIFFLFRFFC